MGKGDQRSKKGKVFAGTFGKTRNRSKIKARVARATSRVKAGKAKKTAKK